jgi:selenocysteine lyase/cysteine desulfurase
MDFGDAGHILLSDRIADDLLQLSQWRGTIHDLGVAADKHGVTRHIFNVHGGNFGNPRTPRKIGQFLLDRQSAKPRHTEAIAAIVPRIAVDRYLSYARIGVPAPSVIDNVIEHFVAPTPEVDAILQLPILLASALHIRSTITFRSNGTQMLRDAIQAVLHHELFHSARAGEEGSRAANKLRVRTDFSLPIGTLVHSDVDHPAIQHMIQITWPGQKVRVSISDLIHKIAENPAQEMFERFCQHVDCNTNVLVLPHVVWSNGAIVDVVKLSRALRRRAPLLNVIVDGTQAAGHIPIEIETYNKENEDIDFYVACGHKWLCGPETSGFSRVGSRFASECTECQQLLASSDLLSDGSGLALHYGGEQIGTNQRGVAKGFLRAMELFHRRNSAEQVYAKIRENADAIRGLISGIRSLRILDPPESMRSGIVSFTSKALGGASLERMHIELDQTGFSPSKYRIQEHSASTLEGKMFIRLSPGPDFAMKHLEVIEAILRGRAHA